MGSRSGVFARNVKVYAFSPQVSPFEFKKLVNRREVSSKPPALHTIESGIGAVRSSYELCDLCDNPAPDLQMLAKSSGFL
jgi:hypothetical protein